MRCRAERISYLSICWAGFLWSMEGGCLPLGRNSSSKLIQLLQIVWLAGEKGVTKDNLAGNALRPRFAFQSEQQPQ